MKHKTAELTGALLDEAVAKAEGLQSWTATMPNAFCPSSDWGRAGPIIERERIGLESGHEQGWLAALPASRAMRDGPQSWDQYDKAEGWQIGPTPLIAAMRCYVASKFGEEVELPD